MQQGWNLMLIFSHGRLPRSCLTASPDSTNAASTVVMGTVRPGARQEMTGGEAPAPHLLSSPALPALFMPIAVFDDGKFLFLAWSAGEFRQLPHRSYQSDAILLPSEKSELP